MSFHHFNYVVGEAYITNRFHLLYFGEYFFAFWFLLLEFYIPCKCLFDFFTIYISLLLNWSFALIWLAVNLGFWTLMLGFSNLHSYICLGFHPLNTAESRIYLFCEVFSIPSLCLFLISSIPPNRFGSLYWQTYHFYRSKWYTSHQYIFYLYQIRLVWKVDPLMKYGLKSI